MTVSSLMDQMAHNCKLLRGYHSHVRMSRDSKTYVPKMAKLQCLSKTSLLVEDKPGGSAVIALLDRHIHRRGAEIAEAAQKNSN